MALELTPELLRELSRYPQFPRTASDLIRVCGMEGAAALIRAWPGQEWPVPVAVGGKTRKGTVRYEQLVELVGVAVAGRIIQWCGGGKLIVPNLKKVMHQRAQERIRDEYDALISGGYSSPEAVFELGIKYSFTGSAVENIIRRPDVELQPAAAQASLF